MPYHVRSESSGHVIALALPACQTRTQQGCITVEKVAGWCLLRCVLHKRPVKFYWPFVLTLCILN